MGQVDLNADYLGYGKDFFFVRENKRRRKRDDEENECD